MDKTEKASYDRALCENCNEEFAFDSDSGLNVRDFPPETTPRYFRAGGVLPCCPKCGGRGDKQSDEPPVYTSVKFSRGVRFKQNEPAPHQQPVRIPNVQAEIDRINEFMIRELLGLNFPAESKRLKELSEGNETKD